jgi:hypothetical protein
MIKQRRNALAPTHLKEEEEDERFFNHYYTND